MDECDNGGHAIGYHPLLKVPPSYALLMFAFTAKHPGQSSEINGMRWEFTADHLSVKVVSEKDGKVTRPKLADFQFRLDSKAKPWTIDLTWLPPGFDGIVREEKGQVTLGLCRMEGDRLEAVFTASGATRPREFKASESCYRLTFRKAKD